MIGHLTSKKRFLFWQHEKITGSEEEPAADEKTSSNKQVCVAEILELPIVVHCQAET